MMLDVRRNVFVVRVSTGQVRYVRVLERIVPSDPVTSARDLVAVVADLTQRKVNKLPDIEHDVTWKDNLPFKLG